MIPPVVEVCSEPLFVAVNGTADPLTCSNGALNERAWRHYAELDPFVMRLGPDVTPVEVGRAMCSDVVQTPTTVSVEEDAYRIAAICYGWNFALDPLDFFPENCE